MKSLQEKVQEGMTEAERCDVLFSMVQRIEDGKKIGDSPEEVLLGEDNCLEEPLKSRLSNMVFWPPEVIQSQVKRLDKPQKWFMLGMFAYYMYYKTDFYSQKNTAVLAPRPVQQNVIMPEDVTGIPFGAAVSSLTAAEPGRRVEGLKSFLLYLREKMKGTAQVQYVLDGNVIGKQIKELTEDIEDLWPNGTVKIGKAVYQILKPPVRIPYRPGTHTYDVQVGHEKRKTTGKKHTFQTTSGLYLYQAPMSMMGQYSGRGPTQLLSLNDEDCENQVKTSMGSVRLDICKLTAGTPPTRSRPLGHIDVEKPTDYKGEAYLINLRYTAKTKCVGIQLTSENGIAIAPARSVSMETLQ